MQKYLGYDLFDKINKTWIDFFKSKESELETIFDKIKGDEIYPNKEDIFKIFKDVGLDEIRVVILGQDPYISSKEIDGVIVPQAQGYSFSVPRGFTIPPSLRNIYKELESTYDGFKYENGDLSKWVTREKMFLLNSALTVKPKKSNSHQKHWIKFTDSVIQYISDNTKNVVFLLMGNFAHDKKKFIDSKKHIVICCGHPSPLNRSNPFKGSGVFKEIDTKMSERKLEKINWMLT